MTLDHATNFPVGADRAFGNPLHAPVGPWMRDTPIIDLMTTNYCPLLFFLTTAPVHYGVELRTHD